MKAAGCGRIVNIGSVVAKNGGNPRPWIDRRESDDAANAAYAAAKAGVHALTLSLAKEVACSAVTVNAVASRTNRRANDGRVSRGPRRRKFPVGRLGAPNEVAAAVGWLCSPDAGFVTGEIIDVNGGLWVD